MSIPGLVQKAQKSTRRDILDIAASDRFFNHEKRQAADALESALRWYCKQQRKYGDEYVNVPGYHQLGREPSKPNPLDCTVRTQALDKVATSFGESVQGILEAGTFFVAGIAGGVFPDDMFSNRTLKFALEFYTERALNAKNLSSGERLKTAMMLGFISANLSAKQFAKEVATSGLRGTLGAVREYISLLCRAVRGDTIAMGKLLNLATVLGLGAGIRRWRRKRSRGGRGRVVDNPSDPFDPVRERPMAEHLAGEGRTVERMPRSGTGRGGDALVDGVPSEFKKLDPGATSSTIKTQVSHSLKRGGQARDMYIDARGSGLTKAEAEHALRRIGHPDIHRGKLDNVTIVGDGFEVKTTFP